MRKRFLSCIFIFLIPLIIFSFGCATRVVYVQPPEPRVETYGPPPYPEAVWIPGYWAYRGGEWVWIPGHWEKRPRSHAVWVPGHWRPKGRGWVWVPGHWEFR